MGVTDGVKAPPATIRGDFAISVQNNLVHGSDSPENAAAEIALWFKPEELAKYVLRDKPEWTAARITAAMAAGEEKHVAVNEKLPVHIVYFTAWPTGDGDVELFDDIYGFDARQGSAGKGRGGDSLMSRR